MYSQLFSPNNLYFCSTQSERRNIGLSKEEFIQKIYDCIDCTINNGAFQFEIRKCGDVYVNNCQKGSIEYICQDLILRKLYRNIKRIYGIEQANRNRIINQMKSILCEDSPQWVIRLDIKHFYESIDRGRIMDRLTGDCRLSYQTICLLRKLFENPIISNGFGLPRGLSVSSVMSELYMKYFDREIRRTDGVFYYARFVDDIIIFCSDKKLRENLWAKIPHMLSELGLELNMSKSFMWSGDDNKGLTYLGYTFFRSPNNNVDISIAERKVNVIKTRLTKSFVRFSKDGNFELLKNRIKFLTGNYTLYNQSTLLPIRVGIFFNYHLLTRRDSLFELDKYYQKILHCRTGRLGGQLNTRMTIEQRKELAKYSFVFGFDKRVNHYFTSAKLAEIANCWR